MASIGSFSRALTRLFNTVLFASTDLGALEQAQNEAVIDALTLVMMADGEVVNEEREQLRRSLVLFSWRSEEPLERFLDGAYYRAVTLGSDAERLQEYIVSIAARLDDRAVLEEVYYQCGHIAGSDHGVEDPETGVLTQMAQAFGISAERQREITAQLIREMDRA